MEPAGFCVHSPLESGAGRSVFTSTQTLIVAVAFEGCLSSSCYRPDALCEVESDAHDHDISATSCSYPTGGSVCTDDCAGVGEPTCQLGPLEDGTHTVRLGDEQVSITTLPMFDGGYCSPSLVGADE